ncbi:methionine aminopeptidase [Clostridium beijerinckii]|uniref:Methionine aminopeptidase n=1 Tax=Clostridium beijerinckii TaxID=1520 RepID=A0AB74VKZ2_CLOBE|nr:methionyl aminopeptidase [Clostridium beijerinckii]NRZ26285.1 methionyl aminopeptidase [Clostridium beijerinckii]NYB98798.1 methionyl aminopeptidase [Clostridium beijerinckii]OOM25431.1 methionine aminopeptidase [Clostridium beijerinckii]QUN36990.1 methionyl aminopeptidase [Clostridium beijerinckii]SQB18880.1 methionine aminopeptidase [Clostridium beijerinckii]
MILDRNEKCWCGSGLKYKKCHLEFDEKIESFKRKGHIVPPRNIIKSQKDIEGIKRSAKINDGVLDLVASKIKAGMSTADIDKLVYDYTIEHGAIPAPLNFEGFPKSVCTSINNEVCHGIPGENIIIKDGDIINVDVSTILDGYYSDASRMFMIGNVSEEAKRLVEVARECMIKGIEAIKPWGFLGDIGAACQEHAHKNGYTIVRALGGHGIGNEFHEDPFVPHIGEKGTGMLLVPGMILTVEPMVNQGTYDVFVDEENEWTIYTADDKLSAQWEHTVLITETGIEILAK